MATFLKNFDTNFVTQLTAWIETKLNNQTNNIGNYITQWKLFEEFFRRPTCLFLSCHWWMISQLKEGIAPPTVLNSDPDLHGLHGTVEQEVSVIVTDLTHQVQTLGQVTAMKESLQQQVWLWYIVLYFLKNHSCDHLNI